MKKLIYFLFFSIVSFQVIYPQELDIKVVDSLYKEDQFYAGVTYNLLGKKPSELSQSGFSIGFHFGFIKDMPINKDRDIAIGIGVGYSANSFNQNLKITKDDLGAISYRILGAEDNYSKNQFSSHLLEIPIEFRWRTSTPVEYKFWRVYTGFKFGYLLANTVKFNGDPEHLKYKGLNDFNRFQYGLTLSMGYNTWNLYAYYALNPIFSKDAMLDGEVIDMHAIKVGLMFYIL
ncbi:porin family protein [Snuella sedimenti]|uniref:porin family protein n=1 Tax=Snuella sedimenti TaxID=2798802 RepID=UPI00293D2B1D|nr:porin family protein [Snuella sedimenti]